MCVYYPGDLGLVVDKKLFQAQRVPSPNLSPLNNRCDIIGNTLKIVLF